MTSIFVKRLDKVESAEEIKRSFYKSLQFNCYDLVKAADTHTFNDTAITSISMLQSPATKKYGYCHSRLLSFKSKRAECRRQIEKLGEKLISFYN